MSPFIHEDFLLSGKFARELYHECAENEPIVDYHCHLDPMDLGYNQFDDITQVWLGADHYKWRAMRWNGVDEEYITGNRSSWEKFRKWAETVPYLMRNPLYHWTHMELARVFGIYETLNGDTARSIYDRCNEMLGSPEFSPQEILLKFRVKVLCTTDDPVDSLVFHGLLKEHFPEPKVLPSWRPDNAVAVDSPDFPEYISRLAEAECVEIRTYEDLLKALRKSHERFASLGCRLSDHGLDTFYADDFTAGEVEGIFGKALAGEAISAAEAGKYKSCLLLDVARMDYEADWAQQYHVGPLRNNYTSRYIAFGPDKGYDAIDDLYCARAGHRFLDRLASEGKLARTVIYNLNPKDTETFVTLAGTFCEGPVPGKVQYGAAWWFLDQEDGIRKQLEALSSMGLLSRFVGMLTDSRSVLSYTRHEYFRRILCDMVGADLESGRLPAGELPRIKEMITDICRRNAENYFGL